MYDTNCSCLGSDLVGGTWWEGEEGGTRDAVEEGRERPSEGDVKAGVFVGVSSPPPSSPLFVLLDFETVRETTLRIPLLACLLACCRHSPSFPSFLSFQTSQTTPLPTPPPPPQLPSPP